MSNQVIPNDVSERFALNQFEIEDFEDDHCTIPMVAPSFVESVIVSREWSDAASEASMTNSNSNSNTGNDDKTTVTTTPRQSRKEARAAKRCN